jgi:hypothetical protein
VVGGALDVGVELGDDDSVGAAGTVGAADERGLAEVVAVFDVADVAELGLPPQAASPQTASSVATGAVLRRGREPRAERRGGILTPRLWPNGPGRSRHLRIAGVGRPTSVT